MQPPALLPVLSCGFLDPGCCRGVSKHQRNQVDRPAGGVGAGNRSDGACLVCDTGRALDDGSGAAKIKEILHPMREHFQYICRSIRTFCQRRSLIRTGIREMCVWMNCCPLQRTVLRGEGARGRSLRRAVSERAGGGVQRGKSGKPESCNGALAAKSKIDKARAKNLS